MSTRNLMPIGRFARSCRLSVKALRHYAELGLLVPAFVDSQTGYRYYDREQARDAVMIGMLRSLDMPLPVIRDALAAEPGELSAIIEEQAARVEAEVAARQRALLSLRHLAGTGLLAAPIEVRERGPLRVARVATVTDAERLVPDSTELIYALLDELRETGAVPIDVLTLNDIDDASGRISVEACASFEGEASALRRAAMTELAGGTFATLQHVGPYETLGLAHHALFAWVQERGHTPQGPIWELYRNDPADVPAEALDTEVMLPLVGEER